MFTTLFIHHSSHYYLLHTYWVPDTMLGKKYEIYALFSQVDDLDISLKRIKLKGQT